jgi:corrinoid protein of di/trimethylamine methyltransferase
MDNRNEILALMAEAVVEGNRDKAASLARRALADRLDLHLVIENGYVAGIQKVGELWEKGEYFLPELMASAEAMKAAMTLLRPGLESSQAELSSKGKVVIGTIEGDIHDIGKNLVASMLSANGFDVIDLGADVKLGIFIDRAVAAKADFICLSALLTTTMLNQRRLIAMLNDRGLRDRFKVLVGGAPVTRRWASDIGADGYGENALAAVKAAKELIARGVKP